MSLLTWLASIEFSQPTLSHSNEVTRIPVCDMTRHHAATPGVSIYILQNSGLYNGSVNITTDELSSKHLKLQRFQSDVLEETGS